MIRDICDICMGNRVIRLPRKQSMASLKTDYHDADNACTEASSAIFPCPQCRDTSATDAALARAEYVLPVPSMDDPALEGLFIKELEPYCEKSIAESIGLFLLSEGLVAFDRSPVDTITRTQKVVGTVAVLPLSKTKEANEYVKTREKAAAIAAVDALVSVILDNLVHRTFWLGRQVAGPTSEGVVKKAHQDWLSKHNQEGGGNVN